MTLGSEFLVKQTPVWPCGVSALQSLLHSTIMLIDAQFYTKASASWVRLYHCLVDIQVHFVVFCPPLIESNQRQQEVRRSLTGRTNRLLIHMTEQR